MTLNVRRYWKLKMFPKMDFQRELYRECRFLCPMRKWEKRQYFISLNSKEENFKALWKDKPSKFRAKGKVNSVQAI